MTTAQIPEKDLRTRAEIVATIASATTTAETRRFEKAGWIRYNRRTFRYDATPKGRREGGM